MNFRHAIGFMIVGAGFGMLPSLAPDWCAATGPDGSSTGELWLELMSTVLITIAMATFARRILGSLAILLEHGASSATETEPVIELPAAAEAAATVLVARPAMALVRPARALAARARLTSALLAPRRAA